MVPTKRLALLSLLLATSFSLPAPAGELRGRLVLPDGKPAAGATVMAVPFETPFARAQREARRGGEPAPLASAATASDGRFALQVARPEARFTLRVSGPGLVATRIEGVWEGSESEELPEAAVGKGEPLAGKVLDPSGAPVAGAEVTLLAGRDPGGPERAPVSAKSGADGTFRFDGASAAGNTVSVEAEGFAPARVTGLRSGALARPVALDEGVPLEGKVLKPGGKGPAKGALVRFDGTAATRWVETGEDGRFTVAHAPRGKGTVAADAGEAGLAEARAALPLPADKPLSLTLALPAYLEGRVVDARSSRPVPRAKLVAKPGEGTLVARSGPDGKYRVGPLAPGLLSLKADEPRYVLWQKGGLLLRHGETKALDVALVPGATLAGRVVDENGAPVANAAGALEKGGQTSLAMMIRRVQAVRGAAAFRTGADGSFRATRLAPGDGQKLSVVHPDFETGTLAGLSLPAGGVKAGVTVVLRRGAAITGLVHDADGHPIAGAEVALRQEMGVRGGRRGATAIVNMIGSGDRPPASTGADGRFALAGVSPGEWAVEVKKRGYGTERVAPVKVSEERTAAPLDVTLVPGGAIAGIVRSKGGAPLEGYSVTARVAGAPPMGGAGRPLQPTGPDGLFTIDSLKAGQSYDLVTFGPEGLGPTKSGIVAPSENVEIVATGTGRIAGRAVDDKSGRPITDFTVSAEPGEAGGRVVRMAVRNVTRAARGFAPSQVVHSEDGTFTLDEVPAGTWSVVVEAKGYQTARVGGVAVEEGATKSDVEVRAAQGGALAGRVLDARSGRGIPDVTIATAPAAGGAPGMAILAGLESELGGTTTDADGRFLVDGLAPGKYRVTAKHADYADASETAEVKESGGNVDIHLVAGGALGGVVLTEGRQPVPGADVTLAEEGEGGFGPRALFGQQATTDETGRFRFEHLTAGRFTLTAALRGHSSPPATAVLNAGDSKDDVVLTLAAGVTIRGVVSGLPEEQRAGVTVNGSGPEGWSASSRAGADGRFELTGAPAGAIVLRAMAGDFLTSSRSASKQVVTSDAEPVLETEIVFDPGYTLSGRITKGGSPAAGASVTANLAGGGGRSASARADDAGAYRLEGLQAGRYSVTAFGGAVGGGPMKSQSVELAGDQTLDIDFATARVSGTVVESGTKRPLADASVELAAADGPGGIRRYSTDSNGRFSAEDLDAKTYTLSVQKPDFLLEKRDVAASEQGSDDLVVELTRGQGLEIQVKDGIYGIPLRDLFVRVTDAAKKPVTVTTVSLDSEGRGEVPSLPPGAYGLWADAGGYAPVTVPSVTVPSRTVLLTMTPGGTLEIHAGPKTFPDGTANVRLTITTAAGEPYQMGGFGAPGTVMLAHPIGRYENFAPGSYTLAGPAGDQKAFSVQEGQTTIVTLP